MTAIVGIARDGQLVIGGDSCVSWSGGHDTISHRKVAPIGKLTVGVCGDMRTLNVVLDQWKPPVQRKGQSDIQYVSGSVVNSLRKILKSSGCLRTEESQEEVMQGEIMVGLNGALYSIDSAFGVSTSAKGECAIGSGADVCRGALHATRSNPDNHARARLALQAAEECAFGVRGPFIILSKNSRARRVKEETI